MSGANQNNQSCDNDQSPTMNAGPALLAGFTEALVIGMLMRLINISAKPIVNGAKPLGA